MASPVTAVSKLLRSPGAALSWALQHANSFHRRRQRQMLTIQSGGVVSVCWSHSRQFHRYITFRRRGGIFRERQHVSRKFGSLHLTVKSKHATEAHCFGLIDTMLNRGAAVIRTQFLTAMSPAVMRCLPTTAANTKVIRCLSFSIES